MPKKNAPFDFNSTVCEITETRRGQERNMYQHIRDLFVHVLQHAPGDLIIDSPQQGKSGNAPDLVIRVATGIQNAKGHEIKHDWVVMEAKSESGIFESAVKREEIFNEKSKYITVGTQWFLMIDPKQIVARPVSIGSQLKFNPANDIVLPWQDSTQKTFADEFGFLHSRNATDSPALRDFRNGDESKIAVVKVDLPPAEKEKLSNTEKKRMQTARRDFLEAIRQSTQLLQNACKQALDGWEKEIGELQQHLNTFATRWQGYDLQLEPFALKGKGRFECKEDKEEHEEQIQKIEGFLRKDKAIGRLVGHALPAYYERIGATNGASFANKHAPFAAESANLILARILLLRFFEDHNFFGNKKHICNGGVAILQKVMEYRELGYGIVLEAAYEQGGKVYPDAFDFVDLNWVLKSPNRQVSQAIELTMLYFSFFDFSTVSGDILTGIYDRFLDRKQRKAKGEFYTPPSIARYIVKRLNIQPDDSVFDPACGSGTFLLEAFAHMNDNDILAGRGLYPQMTETLRNIGGNDLNPFSATMSHIQMLWHLLPLKKELKENGFPNIRISGNNNAIIKRGLNAQSDGIYKSLDKPAHDFVIGNPPYIRPERNDTMMDRDSENIFKPIGGADKDLYSLFVYKALSQWCRPSRKKPGQLGFVLPLSFCDNKSNEQLRQLFAIGGKFRIMEIVDMEAIAPHVFDASVNPIILFAERKPATASDKIIIRVAGQQCIIDKEIREFDIEQSITAEFKYTDVWKDGRILTKLNKQRKIIADKIAATPTTLADIARLYWTGRKGNTIKKWRDTLPKEMQDNKNKPAKPLPSSGKGVLKWEEKQMLGMGAAFRHEFATSTNGDGLDFYKGENICACRIEGEAIKINISPDSVNDPSFWQYRDILPSCGYAFLQISLGITAARFNPQKCVFLNTATLLFPNAEWGDFPLDTVLLSRIYQFYYALYLREGAMSHSYRSHLYPSNLRMIPFPFVLQKSTNQLNKLREDFLRLCETTQNRPTALSRALQKAGAITLQTACRNNKLKMRCADSLQVGEVEINAPAADSIKPQKEKDDYVLSFDKNNYLGIGGDDIAKFAAAALTIFHGKKLTKDKLYQMEIPKDATALKKFQRAVADYDSGGDSLELEKVLDKIDAIIGDAFSLSADEIKTIQTQMRDDDFLCRIRPNLPFSGKKQKGISDSLSSAARYGKNIIE